MYTVNILLRLFTAVDGSSTSSEKSRLWDNSTRSWLQ